MSFGAKADNLIILRERGLNVPHFFVIDDESFTDHDLSDMFKQNPEIKNVKIFSVRSSSSLEDGPELSFAGQFTTFLNVSRIEVADKIRECFSAVSNENNSVYRCIKNDKTSEFKMSVIVQDMIVSDYSGVIFTANPRGVLNESVMVVGKGTGDGIVEDKVPTTTYYKDSFTGASFFETTGSSPILDEILVEQIFDISVKIKEIFAKEMDIEFAIKNNELFILQARPITTLSSDDIKVLDNSNLVESYPGITLPLTASFIQDAYAGVFCGVVKRLTGRKFFTQNELNFMVVSYNGRMYYNLNIWYKIINLLPFSRIIIPIWEHSLGLDSARNLNKHVSFLTKIRVIKNAIKTLLQIPRKMEELDSIFCDTRIYYKKEFSSSLNNKELLKIYKNIQNRIFSEWDITLANDLYAFIYTNAVEKKCGENANEYIGSVANLASMQPLCELKKIVDFINKNVAGEEINKLLSQKDVENFLQVDGKLQKMLVDYIDNYGDRYVEELKLESPTYRTNPLLLIDQIKFYMKSGVLIDIVDKKVVNLPKNINLSRKIKKAQLGIRNREISRLNRTRIYGIVREIFTTIAANFVKGDVISSVDEIFYLTVDEIFSIVDGDEIDVQNLVNERKLQYEYFESLPQFRRLLFSGKIIDKAQISSPQNIAKKNSIKPNVKKMIGIPCSFGEVCGEAIIVSSPKSGIDVTGKIIIAKSTDPGWVFLLSSTLGIIVERGSILSHTAIISRELQIPSVVGVDNATEIIKTGQMIKMNGSTGEIELI